MVSYGGFGGIGFFESAFPVIFIIVFIIVIGVFVITAVKGVSRYAKNEASPVLNVEAKIVSKRTNVTRHANHMNNTMHHHSSTTYYVTFEVESGDRMELSMSGAEFGMLAEGDTGKLTFQGTRYQGFERIRQ